MDAADFCERGFIVKIIPEFRRIELHFDSDHVKNKKTYVEWLKGVQRRVGLGDLDPVPYYTFQDLEEKIRVKIKNMVFVLVDTSRQGGKQRMQIASAKLLMGATLKTLLNCLQ
jgi:hypothetical protein